MRIIPAIDIIEGKCVRLTKGDYSTKKIYSEDPVSMAKSFENAGLKYLHLIDLDGARSGSVKNLRVLERIASETNLKIEFGGGLKSEKEVENVLNNGADHVILGSILVTNPEISESIISRFGPSRIILGLDVYDEKVMINGWFKSAALTLYELIDYWKKKSVDKLICTDIHKDGILSGPSFELYKNIMKKQPDIQLTASGGISSMKDIIELEKIKIESAIIGKAIYENKITLKELYEYIN